MTLNLACSPNFILLYFKTSFFYCDSNSAETRLGMAMWLYMPSASRKLRNISLQASHLPRDEATYAKFNWPYTIPNSIFILSLSNIISLNDPIFLFKSIFHSISFNISRKSCILFLLFL